MDDERRARLLLNLARGGLPARRRSSVDLLLRGDAAALSDALGPRLGARLLSFRRDGAAEREHDRAGAIGAKILLPDDPDFPPALARHPSCPPLIYLLGTPGRATVPAVAIVGARRSSSRMEDFAASLGRACAAAGVPVVSGLARGIDAAAHRGTVDQGGVAIGVLGTGIDQVYPPGNRGLHRRVADSGALITTYPLGTRPLPHHFPVRNQLVAALSAVVCVVQATADSGSMSTAAAALEGQTEVVAVPGAVDDPLSAGTNRLLRDGARPILEAADLVEAVLGPGVPSPPPPAETTDSPIARVIEHAPLAAEEVAALAGLPLEEVVTGLIELELAGRVERVPGGRYRLRRWQ